MGNYTSIFAIDPGTTDSAWVEFDAKSRRILAFAKAPNQSVLNQLERRWAICDGDQPRNRLLAVEMIASYGMPVGREVFETCVWIGRYVQAWDADYRMIYRRDVKLHLCGSPRAKDGNIRQALLDQIGPQGTKKAPGPTYGVSKDVWAALAVAVYCADALKAEAA